MEDIQKLRLLKKKLKLQRLSEAASFERWRERPDLWLSERFGEDPKMVYWDLWGDKYVDHVWDGEKNPLAEMWHSVIKNRFTALSSGTGTGKTFTLARIVYWWLDCWVNSKVYTSAPKEKQLTLQVWAEMNTCFHKFKRIRPNAEITHLLVRVDAKNVMYKESWIAAGFVAGVKANEESTTKAQGLHADRMLIITEETPGMPWPTLNAFIQTSGGDNNRVLALGNPDSIADPLAIFIKSKPVRYIRASALDHPNVVLGFAAVPGAVGAQAVKECRDTYGEEHWFYRSRIRGIFPEQSKDSLFRLEWLIKCWPDTGPDGKPRNEKFAAVFDENSFNAAGVDVANSETGDKGAVAMGKNNRLMFLSQFHCPSASHLAYNMLYTPDELLVKGYNNYGLPTLSSMEIESDFVAVDAVGVGVSTINAFKDLGYECISVQGGQDELLIPQNEKGEPAYNFNNIRPQIYFIAAQDCMHARVILDVDAEIFQKLCDELVVPKMKWAGRTISMESKDDIKKRMAGQSPNLSDCFVYWNYARKGTLIGNNKYVPMI